MHQQAPSRPDHHHGEHDDEVSSTAVWLAAALFVVALAVTALGAAAG